MSGDQLPAVVEPGTSLATIEQPTGAMRIYERFENPLAAMESMGTWFFQSGMFGCKKPQQGIVLALECMTRGRHPTDLIREYHVMGDGKLQKKSMAMLAELRARGGDFKWIKDGEDEKEAEIEITWKGQTTRCSYTIEKAKKAGLVKDSSGWVKNPANMLRARATSNAIGMVVPEIVVGFVTEADEDAATPAVDPKDVEARRDELQQMSDEEPKPTKKKATRKRSTKKKPPEESAAEATAEEPSEPKLVTDEQLRQIVTLSGKLSINPDSLDKMIQAKCGVQQRKDMSHEQATALIANMRKKLGDELPE